MVDFKNIKHVKTPSFKEIELTGDNLEELLTECNRRIRTRSQAFYTDHLRTELTNKGKAIIDKFAGEGTFYTVIFSGFTSVV